jgi:hypothetical protein
MAAAPAFVRVQATLGGAFGGLGARLARQPLLALPAVLLGALLCVGLSSVRFEDRVNKLWVEKGGRLDSELDFLEQFNGTAPGSASKDQVLITVSAAGVLNEMVLREHLLLLKRVYNRDQDEGVGRIRADLAQPYVHPKCAHLPDTASNVPTTTYTMGAICGFLLAANLPAALSCIMARCCCCSVLLVVFSSASIFSVAPLRIRRLFTRLGGCRVSVRAEIDRQTIISYS